MICTASRRGVTLVPSLSLFRPLSLSVSFSHGWSIDTEDFVSRRLADSLLISSGFVVFERVTRLDRAAWFPGHLPSLLDFLASSRIPMSNLIRLKCHPTKVLFSPIEQRANGEKLINERISRSSDSTHSRLSVKPIN